MRGYRKFASLTTAVSFGNILRLQNMKDGIHPEYREVVFQDIGADFSFLTRSTISTKDTVKWTDGKEYPLVKIEVSSKSHPFYTGKQMILDTAGRVDKFRKKYGM
jgi:large subunit ribosomal protein L31